MQPCANQIVHTIQPGDTLYSLAIRYQTTVSRLLMLNPGTDVYNLQIGTGLIVCPGTNVTGPVVPPIGPVPPTEPPVPVLPPIATLPPLDVLRQLLLVIVQWIRENFGETQAQRMSDLLRDNL